MNIRRASSGYVPLQNFFQLPNEFLPLDVTCLFSVSNETDHQPNLVRIQNILNMCSCSTIGDVAALNWNTLRDIRGMGPGSESLLLDLLDRITEDPKNFRNMHLLKNRIHSHENVLMNIDPKSRKCTLHRPDCSKIPMEAEILPHTEFEDAVGWVDFDSVEQSVNFHKEYLQRLEYRLCRICFANEVKQLFKQRGTNLSPQYPV